MVDASYVILCRHRSVHLAKSVEAAFSSAWQATQPYPLFEVSQGGEAQLENPACRGYVGFLPTTNVLDVAHRRGVPVINFSNRFAPTRRCLHVLFDDRATGALAAQHLMQRGFRRFCFIGPLDHNYAKERAEGFGEYLRSKGQPVEILDWKERSRSGNPLEERNKDVAWVSGVLERTSGPVGILAANDGFAERFLMFAKETHPERLPWLGIMGVDDSPLAEGGATHPAFTSIAPPVEALGQAMVRALAEAIENGIRERPVIRIAGARIVERASTGAPVSEDLFLARLLRQIHEEVQLGVCPSVEALARAFSVTPRALLARFNRKMDQSLRDYILHTRLRRAAMLLVDTSMSITDIAHASGFSKHAALTEHFGKAHGMTPSAYRAQRQSGG
jgi:LacI family transcriptional regulator